MDYNNTWLLEYNNIMDQYNLDIFMIEHNNFINIINSTITLNEDANSKFSEKISKAFTIIKNKIKEIWQKIKEIIKFIKDKIKELIGGFFSKIKGAGNKKEIEQINADIKWARNYAKNGISESYIMENENEDKYYTINAVKDVINGEISTINNLMFPFKSFHILLDYAKTEAEILDDFIKDGWDDDTIGEIRKKIDDTIIKLDHEMTDPKNDTLSGKYNSAEALKKNKSIQRGLNKYDSEYDILFEPKNLSGNISDICTFDDISSDLDKFNKIVNEYLKNLNDIEQFANEYVNFLSKSINEMERQIKLNPNKNYRSLSEYNKCLYYLNYFKKCINDMSKNIITESTTVINGVNRAIRHNWVIARRLKNKK